MIKFDWKRIGILAFGLSGVLTLAVALTLVVGGVALAQTPTPVPGAPGGVCPCGGHGAEGFSGGGWHGGFGGSLIDVVAKSLGIEPADLLTELQAGKTIAQLAKEHNVSTETIVNDIVAARKEVLDQAVADGNLTQAQADAILNAMRAIAPTFLERSFGSGASGSWFGPGMKGRGRMGGMGGGRWSAPSTGTTS